MPAAELDAAVADLVAALLSTNAAAARATKALLQQASGNTLAEQAAAERRAQARLLQRPGRRVTVRPSPVRATVPLVVRS